MSTAYSLVPIYPASADLFSSRALADYGPAKHLVQTLIEVNESVRLLQSTLQKTAKFEDYLTFVAGKLQAATVVKDSNPKEISFGPDDRVPYSTIIDWTFEAYEASAFEIYSNSMDQGPICNLYSQNFLAIRKELNRLTKEFDLSIWEKVSRICGCFFTCSPPTVREGLISALIVESYANTVAAARRTVAATPNLVELTPVTD